MNPALKVRLAGERWIPGEATEHKTEEPLGCFVNVAGLAPWSEQPGKDHEVSH